MRVRVACVVLLGSLLLGAAVAAPSRVAKRTVSSGAAGMTERLANGDFEAAGTAERPAASWGFWEKGYELSHEAARGGRNAAQCVAADLRSEYGAAQTVVLNQTQPVPIVAGGWSKAADVSGAPDGGYSIYVDLTYADGTPLWGQISSFDAGTHDWQYREVVIVPERPIRELNLYGLFRGHTGTVTFDDFSLKELALPSGVGLFDGVPTAGGEAPARPGPERLPVELAGKPFAEVDRKTGSLSLGALTGGGFLLRDVGASSDFLQPVTAVTAQGEGKLEFGGSCPELGLDLHATLAREGDLLRIHGEVRDERKQDRAVAVYFVLPADFTGGSFGQDVRHTARIEKPQTYSNMVSIGAGTNGKISRYPLAPVWRGDRALCVATPLDAPRVSRLAYDGASRELYAAFDLGLSPATTRFPSSASFDLVVYGFDPAWGFRSALAEYYRHFPELFTKRVKQEGIWMPFTDIATVQDPADFGFRFKEGNDNVAWDEAHGIYSFVYVEPMSHWLALAPTIPRTYDAALGELKRQVPTDVHAQATLRSAFTRPDGTYDLSIQDAPWCNGALFINSPNPNLLADRPEEMTQGRWLLGAIDAAFKQPGQPGTGAWHAYGGGFEPTDETAHGGKRAIRCVNRPGEEHGAVQTASLGQPQAKDLVARAWSRAEGVTGEPDPDYSLYVDLVYTDGTTSWGHTAPFNTGTHDWQQVEVAIHAEKPVQSAALNLLLRRGHGGKAWFDDVSVTEAGSERNRVQDEGFEPPPAPPQPGVLDGTYLDSLEMACTEQNYRREHWAYDDLPLTFSLTSRQVCSLGMFHTYEFEREISRRMHEQGKLLFANAVLWNFAFPAHALNVLGTETNWGPGGKYVPESDEIMNYRRALCDQKPYLLLLNTNYKTFQAEWVELYFRRCAFYAIFPSFFSENAADNPYWQNPALYNRDRPLFKRYIPVICALSAAGWQPIPWARMDSPSGTVYVERFGEDPAKGVYLTLFNDSQQAAEYTLGIAGAKLGLSAPAAQDVLAGTEVALTREGDQLVLKGSLGGQDLRVLRLGGR